MLEILAEPTSTSYGRLIDLSTVYCDSFSLIWRPEEFCDPAIQIALAPHLVHESQVLEWPGTRLIGGSPATMRTYQLSTLSARILKSAGSLYAWRHPERPEDPAFYRANGALWLGSIAHEGAAWLEDGAASERELREIPLHFRVRAS